MSLTPIGVVKNSINEPGTDDRQTAVCEIVVNEDNVTKDEGRRTRDDS